MKKYDVIIIGSGIAGMTSAIYLRRNNKKILIIENNTPGGQLNKSSDIENYPGFTKIDGPSLAYNIYEQVNKLNTEYLFSKVTSVDFQNNLVITNNEKIQYNYLVIATGRSPRRLEILNAYESQGVSYCAICDGMLYKNKDVLVIGGGASAFEEAIYLSKICKSVTILNRSSNLRAFTKEIDIAKNTSNIKILLNEEIKKITKENETFIVNDKYRINGIFVAVGYLPNSSIFNLKKENDYIIVDDHFKTNIDNVYAIGDVIKKEVYQLVNASYEGMMVALDIIKNQK